MLIKEDAAVIIFPRHNLYIPLCIWELHDYYIDKLSILGEMALQRLFGGIIVKASNKNLPSLRLSVTAAALSSKVTTLVTSTHQFREQPHGLISS